MYLYIFEDGNIGTSIVPPLPQDFQAIEDGILTVIRVVFNKQQGEVEMTAVNPAGQLESIDKSDCQDDETGQYHIPPVGF